MNNSSKNISGAKSVTLTISGAVCDAIVESCGRYILPHYADLEKKACKLLAERFSAKRVSVPQGGTIDVTLTYQDIMHLNKACWRTANLFPADDAFDHAACLVGSVQRTWQASLARPNNASESSALSRAVQELCRVTLARPASSKAFTALVDFFSKKKI